MFYLTVIKDKKIIQQREYYNAATCVEKLAVAHQYYQTKRQVVEIQMLRHDGAMIITRWSTEEL